MNWIIRPILLNTLGCPLRLRTEFQWLEAISAGKW